MDYAAALLALLAVDVLAVISPGPNFLIVTGSSMRRGRSQGLIAVLGILSANLIWVVAALLGLSVLFELVPWLYGTVKILGGGYLLYLALQYWRTPIHTAEAGEQPRPNFSGSYLLGFVTGLTNPKSLVYFGSVFTLFVGPSSPVWVEAVAAAIVLLNGALWYGGVALFFGSTRVQRAYRSIERVLNRVTGAVMAGFGLRLLWERE
jgi:threonine efflux protein